MKNKKHKLKHIGFMLIMVACIVFFGDLLYAVALLPNKSTVPYEMYTQFEKDMKSDNIDVVYYDSDKPNFYYQLKSGDICETSNPESENYKSSLLEHGLVVKSISDLEFFEDYLGKRLGSIFSATAISLALIILMIIIFIFRIKEDTNSISILGAGENGLGITNDDVESKNGETKQGNKNNGKMFSDIGGLKEVKEDIKCLVDFIVNNEKYKEAGAKLPKGVILYGPSGTGKTLLAKAIANEAHVPFLYTSGSDFIEMYVGVGAKRIRELFKQAKMLAPCIVFIDEIDSIGKARSRSGENSEDRKTINALLAEMDGFQEVDNILVIGATNRLEDLDSALMRPGRFTDKYCVPIPQTVSERVEILNIYMKNKCFSEDVDVNDLAKETAGFSPAQLEYWMNEAAIIQVQKDMKYINRSILSDAMNKMILQGHVRKDQSERDEHELKTVAWHEAGHAVLGLIFGNTVSKVTILSSTSGAGGLTISTPKNTSGLLSLKEMEMRVMELYGGRLAELIFNNGQDNLVTTGASNDIERATELVRSMVVSYGMTKEFGLLNLEKAGTDKEYIIDREVKIANRLRDKALSILELNKDNLEWLANKLLAENTVYESELKDMELIY